MTTSQIVFAVVATPVLLAAVYVIYVLYTEMWRRKRAGQPNSVVYLTFVLLITVVGITIMLTAP